MKVIYLLFLCIWGFVLFEAVVTHEEQVEKAIELVEKVSGTSEKKEILETNVTPEHSVFALMSNVLSVYALPSLCYSLVTLAFAFLQFKFSNVEASSLPEVLNETDNSKNPDSPEVIHESVDFCFEQVGNNLFWTNILAMAVVGLIQWFNSLVSGVAYLTSLHAIHKNGSFMTSHVTYGLDLSHLFAFVLIYLKDRFKYSQIFFIFCHFLFLDLFPFPIRICYMFVFALYSGRYYNAENPRIYALFDAPTGKIFLLAKRVITWLTQERLVLIHIFVELKTFRIKNTSPTAKVLLTVIPFVMMLVNIFNYKGVKSLMDWTFVSENGRLPFITLGYNVPQHNEIEKKSDTVADVAPSIDQHKTSPSGDKIVTLG